jgi:hypothetical protein
MQQFGDHGREVFKILVKSTLGNERGATDQGDRWHLASLGVYKPDDGLENPLARRSAFGP